MVTSKPVAEPLSNFYRLLCRTGRSVGCLLRSRLRQSERQEPYLVRTVCSRKTVMDEKKMWGGHARSGTPPHFFRSRRGCSTLRSYWAAVVKLITLTVFAFIETCLNAIRYSWYVVDGSSTPAGILRDVESGGREVYNIWFPS